MSPAALVLRSPRVTAGKALGVPVLCASRSSAEIADLLVCAECNASGPALRPAE